MIFWCCVQVLPMILFSFLQIVFERMRNKRKVIYVLIEVDRCEGEKMGVEEVVCEISQHLQKIKKCHFENYFAIAHHFPFFFFLIATHILYHFQ